jgi:integrase
MSSYKGMRPLSDDEISNCVNHMLLNRRFHARDILLFLMQCKLGFRIKEMLSLRIKDVFPHGEEPGEVVTVQRRNLKGGKRTGTTVTSRTLPIPISLKPLLTVYGRKLRSSGFGPDEPLFPSSAGGCLRVDSCCRLMRKMAKALCMQRVCTHSCRKTFAAKVYSTTGNDIMETKAALGHSNVATTQNYLSWRIGEKSNKEILNF